MNHERPAVSRSSLSTCVVLVTSLARFTPWKPTLMLLLIVYITDASTCPVSSLKIGANGVMTSRVVSRNLDRQLYETRVEIGPFSYMSVALKLSFDNPCSGSRLVSTFASEAAGDPVVFDNVLCATPLLSMYV